ncbi:hypothetical protein FGRMN_5223 [Fusarium graminum]|nr:hypothetical protein FGRMN_5223 [Fusarium graminum]
MAPIIHCVRHGQGVHNLSHANHHLPDPELTPLGEEQARALCTRFPELANVQLIVASPLRRTIQTALLAFPSQLGSGLQVLALPEIQEASNLLCDTGSDLSAIKAEFEKLPVDFSLVEPDWHIKQGRWAPVASSLLERAQLARQWLNDWVNSVNPQGYLATDWANAEVRSFTFAQDESGKPALCETKESRERRVVEPIPLTRKQQLEVKEASLKTWIEWGVIEA